MDRRTTKTRTKRIQINNVVESTTSVHLKRPYTNPNHEKKLEIYYKQGGKTGVSNEVNLPKRFNMLTEIQIATVLEYHAKGMLQKDIAELLGFHYSTISRCIKAYRPD